MQQSSSVATSFTLNWQNALGLGLSVLVAFISGPGGQGGGSFYIPLFSVLLHFSVNDAAALSSSVVFFGCITMVLQAVATSHPHLPGLPVIDYQLVLAMTPSLMLGLALGVLVNAIISHWLLNLLVISVWTWSCIQLLLTYIKARSKEQQLLEQQEQKAQQQQQHQQQHLLRQQQQQQTATAGALPLPPAAAPTSQSSNADLQVKVFSAEDCKGVQPVQSATSGGPCKCSQEAVRLGSAARAALAIIRSWAAFQPWKTMLVICLMFAFFITMQVVRFSATAACSVAYWTLLGVLAGVSAIAAVAVSLWLLRNNSSSMQQAADLACNALPQVNYHVAAAAGALAVRPSRVAAAASVVHMTAMRLVKINVQMVVAGLMLGAWPLSPIIMALPGMHPQVAAGTSKLMLFMITGGAGLSFIASGRINTAYTLAYGLTNAIATPIGVWVMDKVIRRTGRPSHLIMLTIVRLAACVVVQIAFSAVPNILALAGGLPRAGFLEHGVCH